MAVLPPPETGDFMADRKGPKVHCNLPRAQRFPLSLPVTLKANGELNCTRTDDISSSGLCFQMASEMEVGSTVDLTICLPAHMIGAEDDVEVACRGRVVRSFEDEGRRGVGVVIDEYEFGRLADAGRGLVCEHSE
jgi:hypothetical protein